MTIEVDKILNKKCPMHLNDLFVYKDSCYSFRKTNTVEVPQVRTTYHEQKNKNESTKQNE
jgi:hypothetical protein